jgi:hypothetical protein
MAAWIPDRDRFLHLPTRQIYAQVYPQKLSVSMLLNGTRRWYITEHFDAPPKDNSYFPHYLETVLNRQADLLRLLAEHGIYRVFIPVYSEHQTQRHPEALKYLLKGIQTLVQHPKLIEVYREYAWGVRFYGDTSHFPEDFAARLRNSPAFCDGEPRHYVYYGVDGGNPHNYALRLAHEFSLKHQRPPTWEDMLAAYYGDSTIRPIDILIGFNRIYSRMGIPHLLDGEESIYITVVSPIVLSALGLRAILHDHLFHRHDIGRDYQYIHPREVRRLKQFYAANRNTILGLTEKFDDLVYPASQVNWPEGKGDLITDLREAASGD